VHWADLLWDLSGHCRFDAISDVTGADAAEKAQNVTPRAIPCYFFLIYVVFSFLFLN